MKQPGVRAGKSERNSIPVLHTFTDKAYKTPVQTMAAVTRHPRRCSDASPYPMDGLPVSTGPNRILPTCQANKEV